MADGEAERTGAGALEGQVANAQGIPAGVPEVTPPEPTPQAPSQAEIDSKIAALEQRLERQERQHAEDLRRARQSFHDTAESIVARIDARYQAARQGIDQLEQSQRLNPDEARAERFALKEKIEAEEFAKARQEQAQSQAFSATQSGDLSSRVTNQLIKIWNDSGLSQSDPEFSTLPTDLSGLDPFDAVETYRTAVSTAKAKKEQRVKAQQPPKAPAPATPKGSSTAPFVDMGGGAPAAAQYKPKATLDDADDIAGAIVEKFYKKKEE